jgi:magnesium transporter
MPFNAYYLTPGGDLRKDLSEADIAAAFASKTGLLWVDVPGITTEDGAALERIFGFHHLAVEDCVSPAIHSPKIDEFPDCLFIILHGINHAGETDLVETAELCFFLGTGFLVTAHNDPLYSIASVRNAVETDARPMRRGADFLAHELADTLVDNVMPTIDRMADVADDIEEDVIRLRSRNILDGILKLKRSAMRVHRIMAPQREVLNRLSRGEFSQVGPDARIFFRDIYDHLVRLEDLNQSTLDRADNSLATYLSAVANRQNETMRVLAIVATIFMPLTLLAGIYGMNFKYMPELEWHWGYFAVLGIIGTVILIMILRFWTGGWLSLGRKHASWVKPFVVEAARLRGHLLPAARRRMEPPEGPAASEGNHD